MTPTENNENVAAGCLLALFIIVASTLALTVGWNFGITEFVAACGGHAGHVNVVDTFLAVMFVRLLLPTRRASA